MKKDITSLLRIWVLLVLFLPGVSLAQQQKSRKSQIRQMVIASKILDESGTPVSNAQVSTQEGTVSTYSGPDGSFTLSVFPGDLVLIQANGYEDKVIQLTGEDLPTTYTIEKRPLYSSSRDALRLPMGITTDKRSTTSAISGINGAELESYPDMVLSNALQGRLAGLTVRQNPGGLGNNTAALIIRGLSRGGSDGALTIVDGIERPIDDLIPAEIESIEVLKDAPAKILYGARAANGVVLITTKRGKANTRITRASVEYGTMLPTRMPEFLSAYDYAMLYNEARTNDGLEPIYSNTDLAGYQQSAGANDQRFPNADYYDYFLKNSAPYRRASFQFLGGDSHTQYALILGYTGASGLEEINTPTNNRFNVRGNLDLEVTPSLRAFAGVAGVINVTNTADINSATVFSRLSSHRPNEYPFEIDNEELRNQNYELGTASIPPLGGSLLHPDNLYGRLMYGGTQVGKSFTGQGKLGLDLSLNQFAQGLSVKTFLTFDNYQSFTRGQTEDPATYGQRWFTNDAGEDQVTYYKLQKRIIEADQVRRDQNTARTLGWVGNMNYARTMGMHDLSADLSYFYYRNESSGQLQDVENTNLSLRLAYGLQNKYYVEGTLAYMGSNRFADQNRHMVSYAGGLAWVISEESFLKSSQALDFLKIKANVGVLGYDRATDFYLFENRWYNNGNIRLNERNQNTVPRTSIALTGNPNLEWEKSREINVGVEGLALKQRLQFALNYFNERRYDIIIKPSAQYTALHGGLFPFANYGETANQGVDGYLSWRQTIGEVQVQIGGNVVYSKNEVVQTDEILHPDEYLRQTGRPSDALFGYVARGLFRDQAQVDGHAQQTFGPYGPGDIMYEDLNNDGLIDSRDRKMIGNTFPRTTLGVDVNLYYRGFGLYVLGTSELGVDKILNNSYYWNYGEGKYSTQTQDRWHAQNNPDGTYPRLTTTTGANNFIGSTFWQEDASFLRLKNVELSYTFARPLAFAKSSRFYVRGTNLLVLSKIKDLDPEVTNGGVSNYPLFRTITGGVSLSF